MNRFIPSRVLLILAAAFVTFLAGMTALTVVREVSPEPGPTRRVLPLEEDPPQGASTPPSVPVAHPEIDPGRDVVERRLEWVENERERLLSPDDEWRAKIDAEMAPYGIVPPDVMNQEQFDLRVRQWLEGRGAGRLDADPDALLHEEVDALEQEAFELRTELGE